MDGKVATDQPILTSRDKITRVIGNFWNGISEGWQAIWGPHIHHGYYAEHESLTPLEAQEKLIVKLTDLLTLTPEKVILDVGCGMGGSSLHLAKKPVAHVTGITLSQKQVAMALARAHAAKIENVDFRVEDALSLKSVADGSVDVIWSLESCEQFFDKKMFLQQAFRVLKPRGQLMLATWCSDKESYEKQEAAQYQQLCRAFDLPYMPTMDHYKRLLEKCHFTVEKIFDWSELVAPSWDIGISLAQGYSFVKLLKMSGWRGFRFARQLKLMRNAFRDNRVRYGVFIAKKY